MTWRWKDNISVKLETQSGYHLYFKLRKHTASQSFNKNPMPSCSRRCCSHAQTTYAYMFACSVHQSPPPAPVMALNTSGPSAFLFPLLLATGSSILSTVIFWPPPVLTPHLLLATRLTTILRLRVFFQSISKTFTQIISINYIYMSINSSILYLNLPEWYYTMHVSCFFSLNMAF